MSRRNARRKISEVPVCAEIEDFCHDGRGLSHVDGRVVFVEGALPGERVEMEYIAVKRDFAETRVTQVFEASPLRVEPKCEYYGVCGGCSLQHLEPELQIEIKQRILEQQFRRIGRLEPVPFWPPIRGPLWAYRHKTRLGVKYLAKKQRVLVGFREKSGRYLADMQHCEVLHPMLGSRLGEIGEVIFSLSIRDRIPQVEAAVGDCACVLVLRNLSPASENDRRILAEYGRLQGFSIYLQPKGPDSLEPVDGVAGRSLSYFLPKYGIEFHFEPLQFTQVNVEINQILIDRAIEVLEPTENDRVIDLFCGIGNFTLPLARRAQQVVGVEANPELIATARKNAEINGIGNVDFEIADLNQNLDAESWANQTYSLALLDPSRAGAEEVLNYLPRWGVRRVVYISCNPATLARDSAILCTQLGYRMQGAGVMDMFPQTSHVESMACFEKAL